MPPAHICRGSGYYLKPLQGPLGAHKTNEKDAFTGQGPSVWAGRCLPHHLFSVQSGLWTPQLRQPGASSRPFLTYRLLSPALTPTPDMPLLCPPSLAPLSHGCRFLFCLHNVQVWLSKVYTLRYSHIGHKGDFQLKLIYFRNIYWLPVMWAIWRDVRLQNTSSFSVKNKDLCWRETCTQGERSGLGAPISQAIQPLCLGAWPQSAWCPALPPRHHVLPQDPTPSSPCCSPLSSMPTTPGQWSVLSQLCLSKALVSLSWDNLQVNFLAPKMSQVSC